MVIVMQPGVKAEQIQQIAARLEEVGLGVHLSEGKFRTIIGAIGDEKLVRQMSLEALPFVEKVLPITQPFKLVTNFNRKFCLSERHLHR